MKKICVFITLMFIVGTNVSAQDAGDVLYIYSQGEMVYSIPVADIDSLNFIDPDAVIEPGVLEESEYYKEYKEKGAVPYVNAADGHPEPGHAIPGKVMLVFFDKGAEGVTYHDADPGCTGGYRNDTGVDSKKTSNGDGDKPTTLPYTDPAPPASMQMGMPYIGWTSTGEWVNLTVDIQETGTYEVDLFYSANGANSQVTLAIDGVNVTNAIGLPTTSYYHQWYEKPIAEVTLEKGRRVLTFKQTRVDGNNWGYLTFKKK